MAGKLYIRERCREREREREKATNGRDNYLQNFLQKKSSQIFLGNAKKKNNFLEKNHVTERERESK